MRTLLVLALLLTPAVPLVAADPPKPLKVFILAGQSNMEGKAKMSLVEYQTDQLVTTDAFWDADASAVFRKGWREHPDEWNKVGSDYPYHYLGSAKTMCRIGRALGEAVIELRGEKK